jgi:hypothetical protein
VSPRIHNIIGALAVSFAVLSLSLAGCSTVPQTIIKTATPPDGLLQDCAHAPRPSDNTVNGLALGIIAERTVVESCDWADKKALRAWKAGVEAGQQVSK